MYTASELEYAINKVEVKILICPQTSSIRNYGKIIFELISDISERDPHHLKCPKLKTLNKIIFYSSDTDFPGVIQWNELEQAAQQNHFKSLSEIKVE